MCTRKQKNKPSHVFNDLFQQWIALSTEHAVRLSYEFMQNVHVGI